MGREPCAQIQQHVGALTDLRKIQTQLGYDLPGNFGTARGDPLPLFGQEKIDAALVLAPHVVAAAERTGLNAYDVLNQQSRHLPPGSEGLIVNEYFQGNRTPYTDGQARGILWGLSLRHGPEHIYHAIQESVCYGTEHNLRAMREAGIDVQKIVACGGATNSPEWMQMHADVTGVPITLTEDRLMASAAIIGDSKSPVTG